MPATSGGQRFPQGQLWAIAVANHPLEGRCNLAAQAQRSGRPHRLISAKLRPGPLPLFLRRRFSSAACALLAATLAPVPALAQSSAPPAGASSLGVMQSPTSAEFSPELLQDDAYILGPGDGLELRFLMESSLSTTAEILNDGTASLPLLGPVRLTGLTLSQASLWLQSLYARQLLRPDLQLSVARPRPLRIAVVGEVERQGVYTLTTSEASLTEASVGISGLPTLVDAIQKAGGITDQADLRQVVLQRRLPGDRPLFKRTRLNMLALVFEGDLAQNPLLFDGDTIRVLKADEPVVEISELATTTIVPSTIAVNVVGEVKGPGTISVPANTPLIQAILAAGGPVQWRADTADVELVRINRNGTATRERFRINYSQGASNAKNPPLRDRDTVIVNRSALAKTSDAIGAITQPITGLVNALTLFDLIDRNR
jgi:polysaccharide export outer membrane protein